MVRQLAQVAEYPLATLVLAHVVLYAELIGLWRANHLSVEQTSIFFYSTVRYVLLTISVADPGSGAFLPRSGMDKKTGSGSGIKKNRIILFPRAKKPIFWVKLRYLNYLMPIRDPGWKKFRSGS